MDRLIYYPSFEVIDENWLKFALLYVENLHPIIPLAGMSHLSYQYRELIDTTDLINPLPVDKIEGIRATREAIFILDAILKNPHNYSDIFGAKDYLYGWKFKDNQDYTLFEDKYTDELRAFIKKSKLGSSSKYGIDVSKEVGHIYMTVLANVIGDIHQISPITDQSLMDKFSIYLGKPKRNDVKAAKVAKRIIRMSIPQDLDNISVQKIVQFRNRPSFNKNIREFRKHLIKALENDTGDDPIGTFFNTRGGLIEDITDEIGSIASGLIPVVITIMNLMSGDIVTAATLTKDIAQNIPAYFLFNNAWQNTKIKRCTRRYLAELVTLN